MFTLLMTTGSVERNGGEWARLVTMYIESIFRSELKCAKSQKMNKNTDIRPESCHTQYKEI